MEFYDVKNIQGFLKNPFLKYPLVLISAIAIIKTGYDWSYPCQVDSIKKTKQPLRFDILSELDG